jgi:hypothetical protein
MKIDVRGRRAGKTFDLIRTAHENGGYIVCINQLEARRIFQEAEEMGMPIPFPLTPQEWLRGSYSPTIPALYFDNLDMILQAITRVPIHTVTMNQEET